MDAAAILQQAEEVRRFHRFPYYQIIEGYCVWEVVPDLPDLHQLQLSIQTVLDVGKPFQVRLRAGVLLLQAYRSVPVTGTSPQMEATVRLGFRVLNLITSTPPLAVAA